MTEAKQYKAVEANPTKLGQTVEKPPYVSSEDFITKAALYVKTRVDGFAAPTTISFECYGACKKETTWTRLHSEEVVGQGRGHNERVGDWSLHTLAYKCHRCGQSSLTVMYREVSREKRIILQSPPSGISAPPLSPPTGIEVLAEVMKVGQYPAPSVDMPKALEGNLGKNASDLYRKALISRNNGYGLAAAVYIRRVVEDKTNELIAVVGDLAESNGVDPVTVAKIRAAGDSKDYVPYEDKLKFAGAVFPDSLKVGSINPLKSLYGLVSEGIHGLSEERCVEIADQTFVVFDYLFTNLKAQIVDRRKFVEHVKKLS